MIKFIEIPLKNGKMMLLNVNAIHSIVASNDGDYGCDICCINDDYETTPLKCMIPYNKFIDFLKAKNLLGTM